MSVILPIDDDTRFRISTATDGQTAFSVNFPFQANADITVVKLVNGVSTILDEGEDYSLAGAGDAGGGTVTLNAPAEAGWQIIRFGQIELVRRSSIVRNGRYSSQATDDDLDRAILGLQEARRDLGRALKVALGHDPVDAEPGADNTLAIWVGGRLAGGPLYSGELGGLPGPGVIPGGTTHQVLRKRTNSDFDTEWFPTVASIDGQTGDVIVTHPQSGIAVLDFGAFPGATDATVTVTGLDRLLVDSVVAAWVSPGAGTADHSADEHKVAGMSVRVADVIAGVGFTIFASNNEPSGQQGARHYGRWNIAWHWIEKGTT